MIKIASISDMHGNLDITIEKSDLLIIAGDILPLDIQMNTRGSKKWLKSIFIPWCESLDVDNIFLVGGNHDFYLQNHTQEFRDMIKYTNIRYLQDESAVYIGENGKVYNIYGTPWCHQFGNWAFMGYSDEALKDIYSKMPDNIDILISHDAPYGYSDTIIEDVPWGNGEHIGCKPLAEVVLEKKPKLLLHGHLHSSNHEMELMENTMVYNVSILNEHYKIAFKPLYLEF